MITPSPTFGHSSITHELCHIAEPHHGTAFFDLLDRVMPDWERRKQRLEQIMA